METNHMDNGIPENAISLYNQTDDALEDFPVLKAFQQYIDAEQAKSRKRLLTMGIFFGVMTFVIIAIFVALLMRTTSQNQALNDRLLDLAFRDRDNRGPVVAQPQQDNSGLMALTAKLDEMQKKLAESQQKAAEQQQRASMVVTPVTTQASPSREALEVERLKIMLEAEKEKLAAEKEKRRQAELEEYRRKHYPELYQQPMTRKRVRDADEDIDAVLDELSKDPDDEDEEERPKAKRNDKKRKRPTKKIESLDDDDGVSYFEEDEAEEEVELEKKAKPENKNSIPVNVQGSSSNWDVPLE